ncbi:exodeoxyribonuclease VII, small subunit [Pseudomonas savastanoi pv. phaseolicola 1448A]|nr:exodeoxyribonuclease VII, small subunit [Pseudomonas savastanoi pv. phaseolicola 1448A]
MLPLHCSVAVICPEALALLVSRGLTSTGNAPMARKKAALDFEQSLADLQALVERLENGELSLEDSLTAFEQGVRLTRDCQSALTQAEQKVQVLLERDGELSEEPFDDAELPE